ncbi:MAG: MarR family transcriptional regulator [Kitasatospora sp.]|jgi:DNA-binding MarR family transcriptional regulator|nr:MarR family transcriptional regulator [Kitasatospora sp.]
MAEPTLEQQIAVYQREFKDLDPQVEKIISAIVRLSRRLNVAYDRHLADLEISVAEWQVLKGLVLSGQPYRLSPGELAKEMGLTPAAMTHRIDRMVASGLVTRERDESNRVRVIIGLTELGRDKWVECMRMGVDFEGQLLSDLGPQQRDDLGDMLALLLRRVEES